MLPYGFSRSTTNCKIAKLPPPEILFLEKNIKACRMIKTASDCSGTGAQVQIRMSPLSITKQDYLAVPPLPIGLECPQQVDHHLRE
jgi:hypothetical protein